MKTRHNHTSWFLLLLAAMTLVVFWPLYNGAYTLRGEAADLSLPVLSHIREALLEGEWPLWNKYQDQGIATSLRPMFWNPLYLITGGLFSFPGHALNVLYLMLIFTGGLGFYKLSGLFLKDKRIAIVSGLCYPLLGFFVVQSQFLDLITAAAWLPLLIYVSFRYQENGKSRYLILLAIGYYLFVTGTSVGFVVMGTIVILAIMIYGNSSKNHSIFRSLKITSTLLVAGFLVWRLYWLRWRSFVETADFGRVKTTFDQNIDDLSSLVLSKTTALPPEFPDLMGHQFNCYTGIIILFLALFSIWHSRTKTDLKLGALCLTLLGLIVLSPLFEKISSGTPGLIPIDITTSLKILLTGSVLLLGLRGFQKIVSIPNTGRILFLLLALLFAGFALFTRGDTALTSWFLQLDLWKSTLFLLLTGLACWFGQANMRLLLIGGLIIADIGLSNFLNQDSHLYNDYPSSVFLSQISFPEKKTNPVDLTKPIGRYSDQDFKIGSLERNTGTLVKEIVRDGYWPWETKRQAQTTNSPERQMQLRFPLFYYSKDTTSRARPSYTNFDDPIHILTQKDHFWKLSVQSKYEKFLIFNQNFDKNWLAYIDDKQVPVAKISAGMMKIAISPGLHTITFKYRTNGLLHIFVVFMIIQILFVVVMVIRRRYPFSTLIILFPMAVLFILSRSAPTSKGVEQVVQETKQDSAVFKFNYERHAPFWFTRPNQITPENSYDGYRSESLSQHEEYSATLQIPGHALNSKKELVFNFHIFAAEPIEAAVVLKTYSREDDSYNIQYIKSLDTGQWRTIEGRFSLQELQGPLVKAEFYIWNHQKKDFLIDDIRIKLIP